MSNVFIKTVKQILRGEKRASLKKFLNYIDAVFGKKFKGNHFNNIYFDGNAQDCIDDNQSPLHKIIKEHQGNITDKWEQYLQIYEKIFAPFIIRAKPINILEIGILNGGFLQVLEKFFPKGSKIIGLDIEKKCADLKLGGGGSSIEIIIGDAAQEDFLDKSFKDSKFDIIIDDASHVNRNTIITFEAMFDKLNYGGIYIIEDCHTSYWNNAAGGFQRKGSVIEYFKTLIDALHFYYIHPEITAKIKNAYLKKFNSSIAAIYFYDSVIAVEKYVKDKTLPFRRYIAGQNAPIFRDDCALTINQDTKFEKFFA
ncbi:MAG: class I SAM-dependent methyltransferase [Elusimicrobiota bacterium]|jgi:SAM-dependent methyltransferase|nr:class I SAM-dependent methyltransferase [Elusimicrobiota bacterium]